MMVEFLKQVGTWQISSEVLKMCGVKNELTSSCYV